MAEAGSIWIRLGLDTDDFSRGLVQAKQNLVTWRDETNKSTTDMAKWGAAITATTAPLLAAAAAARQAAEEYGGLAQELKDLSLVTSFSTEKLQQLRYATVLSGDSFGMISASISRLSLSMAEAADSTSAASEAFAKLGIDPNGRSPDEVFDLTAIALMRIEDTTTRNRIAMELYGKSYRDLLPFMETYIDNLDEIKSKEVFSDETLDRLDRAKTGWDKIGDSIYNAGMSTTDFILKIQEAENRFNPLNWWLNPATQGATASSSPEITIVADRIANLTDRFSGLSEEEVRLISLQDEITEATEKYNAALAGGDQKAFDVAARNLQNLRNDYAELKQEMAEAAAKALESSKTITQAWDASSVVGTAGSQMQLFLQREMEAGVDYQSALNNWSQGVPTSTEPRAGTLGAAKSKSKSTDKKSQSTDVKNQTKVVESELKDQAAAYTSLSETIQDTWTTIEEAALVHYTAMSEIARIYMQKLMDDWYKTAQYITTTIAYSQVIGVEDGTPSATPMAFSGAAPPVLDQIDFSGAGVGGGGEQAGGASGGGTTVNVEQNVTIVSPQGTPAQNAAAVRKANQSLGAEITKGVY